MKDPAASHILPGSTVLVVDDDEVYRSGLARAFVRRGFLAYEAPSAPEALALAAAHPIDYASVDLRMPGGSGLPLVGQFKRLHPEAVIVVLTGYGSIATAVEAMRLGATHYLVKPADAKDLLLAFQRGSPAIEAAAEHEVPSLARAEWEHINRVLDDCGGNISKAARLLRIERKSLQRKLAKYAVPR